MCLINAKHVHYILVHQAAPLSSCLTKQSTKPNANVMYVWVLHCVWVAVNMLALWSLYWLDQLFLILSYASSWIKSSPKQFKSNQDQLFLLNANPRVLLMPTIVNYFLVWKYQSRAKISARLHKVEQSGHSWSELGNMQPGSALPS